jgi:hypothetical protein
MKSKELAGGRFRLSSVKKTCRHPVGHAGMQSEQLGKGRQALALVDRFHREAPISNALQDIQPAYPPVNLPLGHLGYAV